MAWTKEEIEKFQSDNVKALAAVNATLQPDEGLSDEKVGIFCTGQAGDTLTISSVLKYRKEIFGNRKIVWFINAPNAFLLQYAPISEVRPWPWAGNGLPKDCPDFWPLLCDKDNRLNKELAKDFELTADLSDGWFPAPYMVEPPRRHGLDYPSVSKKIFGVPDHYQWHPFITFSDYEIETAGEFVDNLPPNRKSVIIESFAGSGQSSLDESMIAGTILKCTEVWGECNFIFASHKFLKKEEKFPAYLFETENVFSIADFAIRKCALIASHCDLMISVSSGITVACSAWNLTQPPTLQYCGSFVCSTVSLCHNPATFKLVTADDKKGGAAKAEYYLKLNQLLSQ